MLSSWIWRSSQAPFAVLSMMGTAASAGAPEPAPAAEPDRSVQVAEEELQHFIFVGGDDLANHETLLARGDISGAQVVYTWRGLEPHEGEYDFDKVERDLKLANTLGKRLFCPVAGSFLPS